MMKKRIAAAFVFVFLLVFMFYFENKPNVETASGDQQINYNELDDQVDDQADDQVDDQVRNDHDYNPNLELLCTGKIDRVPFGIGTSSLEIEKQWGEPDGKENFLGGLLLSYADIFFLTDGFISGESMQAGEIIAIIYTGEETVYGIRTEMTSLQVEEILGKPDHTYISENSELYNDGSLIINYIGGAYTVNIEIDDDRGLVQSISIWSRE